MLIAVQSPAKLSQPFFGGGHLAIVVGSEQEEALSEERSDDLSDQTRWMIAVRDRRDREAFGRLFDFYAPRLKAVAMRSGANAAQAEDIVQDVMLAVWHRAAQFDAARAQVSGCPKSPDRSRPPGPAPRAGRDRRAGYSL